MCHVSRVAGAALAAMMSVMSAAAQEAVKSSSSLEAVSGTAGVEVSVVDPTDAVIQGASIVISEKTSSYAIHGESDNIGLFQALNLRPGSWTLAVYKAGFARQEMTVTLRDRDTFRFVMELRVAVMGEVVMVEGPVPSESTSLMPDLVSGNESSEANTQSPPVGRGNKLSRLLHKPHF